MSVSLLVFWVALGIGLWVLEFFTPALVAGSAGTAALLMLLIGQWIPHPFVQLFVFALVASILIVLSRKLVPRTDPELENPFFQEEGTVTAAIEPGATGRVAFGGTTWNAHCRSLSRVPTGTKVLIVGQKGNTLSVVPLEPLE
ncbi:NfeD family protein [Gloeobacter kilaueensis]|uniref:Membrane protein implicated in regulation of membrane protease activity n=1 Tax=Gloeobacter kilaueensis (strain ATCC BAA-2537 / CCAP 1431/1 / ULC 316 / JS1) TaxID=1183438 RepID=U5QHI4_GLOK1|nr:NfeD family protein [Gloeobacter kilaueensis]AGY58323.1 membrane protein implicated in regulation of membrane protease activity [Gloeobacter kilaueensis JS1]